MAWLWLFTLHACVLDAPTVDASAARVGSLPSSVLTAPQAGRAMAVGDLNGDGVVDLAATTEQDVTASVQVWYGQTDATFVLGPLLAVPGEILWETARRPQQDNLPSLAVVDLQRDGWDDLVLCWANMGADCHAWFGGPAGLTPPSSHPHLGRRLANAGDVDGDGGDELYAVETFALGESIMFSVREVILNGDRLDFNDVFGGNYAWFSYTASSPWWIVGSGDLNADGLDDLAVGFRGDHMAHSARLEVHTVAGAGLSAVPAYQWALAGAETYDALMPARGRGDLTGDGLDDLVILQRDYVDEVRVYPGSPGGLATDPAFSLAAPVSEPAWADDALIAGDLDGDGAVDLLVASDVDGQGRVYRYRNEGGQLAPMPDQYWQGEVADARLGVAMVALGDMDGDGAAEVAISEPGNDQILIVRGSPGEACAPGETPVLRYDDVDGDGITSAWSPRAVCGQASEPPGDDCDDAQPAVFPGAPDTGLWLDFDCDGFAHCPLDADQDHAGGPVFIDAPTFFCANPILHTEDLAGDCDDANVRIHPMATDDPTNDIDEDCDGVTLCYADLDGDGHLGHDVEPRVGCGGPPTDCNDGDPDVHRGAVEGPADGIDSNCDGYEICFWDGDHDGWGSGRTSVLGLVCNDRAVAQAGDCDDAARSVHPEAWDEPDDGLDADCDSTDSPDLAVSSVAGDGLELRYEDVTRRGRIVLVVSRVGLGAGPCLPWMGGDCSALVQPRVVWQGRSASGSGALRLQPPPAAAGAQVVFELWSVDGVKVAASEAVPFLVP